MNDNFVGLFGSVRAKSAFALWYWFDLIYDLYEAGLGVNQNGGFAINILCTDIYAVCVEI